MRLANLSVVMMLRRLSNAVAKRFPTYQHLVQVPLPPLPGQAGLLTEKEMARLELLTTVTENKHYVSIVILMHQLYHLETTCLTASNWFSRSCSLRSCGPRPA